MKAWHILAPSDSKHTRTTLVTVTSFRPGVRTPCSVVFFCGTTMDPVWAVGIVSATQQLGFSQFSKLSQTFSLKQKSRCLCGMGATQDLSYTFVESHGADLAMKVMSCACPSIMCVCLEAGYPKILCFIILSPIRIRGYRSTHPIFFPSGHIHVPPRRVPCGPGSF